MSPETMACFEMHRQLSEQASYLARGVGPAENERANQIRLGASCVKLAVRRVLVARDEREALRSWLEIELGERQIRAATYQALRRGEFTEQQYDFLFALAADATCLRRNEIGRLRHRMRVLSMI